jgi:hypothetical protein
VWLCDCGRGWPDARSVRICRSERHAVEERPIAWLAVDQKRLQDVLLLERTECELCLVELAHQVPCGYRCGYPVVWLARSRLHGRIPISVYSARSVRCPSCSGMGRCLRCNNHGAVFVCRMHFLDCPCAPPPLGSLAGTAGTHHPTGMAR